MANTTTVEKALARLAEPRAFVAIGAKATFEEFARVEFARLVLKGRSVEDAESEAIASTKQYMPE